MLADRTYQPERDGMAPAAIHTKCAKAVDKAVENYSAGLAGRLIQHIASNLSSATIDEGDITTNKKRQGHVRPCLYIYSCR